MNTIPLPVMPIASNILLPALPPVTPPTTVDALPFELPQFANMAAPVEKTVGEPKSDEDPQLEDLPMDTGLLLELAGFVAPSPLAPAASRQAPATDAAPKPVTGASTPVLTTLMDARILASLASPEPAEEKAIARPFAPPTPVFPAALLPEASKRVVAEPLPKHAPEAQTLTLAQAIAKPVSRESKPILIAGTDVQAQGNDAKAPGTIVSASVPPAIFDPAGIPARGPDPVVTVTPQPEIVDRQLDFARKDLWLGELARDIVALGDRGEALSFRLLPRALGQLDVSIAPSDRGLSIHMAASSEDARSIVAAAQPRLVDEIRSQGVRVSDASVGHGGANDGRGGRAAEGRPPLIEIAPTAVEAETTPPAGASARGLFA